MIDRATENTVTAKAQQTPLQLCIDKLVSESKKEVSAQFGTGADNARYGGVSSKGRVYHHKFACHAYMNGMLQQQGNQRPVVVYSQYVHPAKSHKMEETTIRFFDWITGQSYTMSPWAAVLQGCSEEAYKFMDGNAFSYGFVFDNLDTVPANYLHNFLVASRMPKEWPSLIKMWQRFIDAGVDPALAMFFSAVFQERQTYKSGVYTPLGHYYMSGMNHYDWPLDHATCGEDYLLNFMHGRVDTSVLCPPWAVADRYIPVNRIWGDNALGSGTKGTYLHELFERYKSTSSISEAEAQSMGSVLGRFDWFRGWFLRIEDVLRIVQAENTRLLKVAS